MGATKTGGGRRTKSDGFTPEERAAMRARARELKGRADGEAALREAIDGMSGTDRTLAERVHAIVTEHAPGLTPKTWYGMPAWADAEGKVVLFFQSAAKFKARYATVGFNDAAKLDRGSMWPTSFAVTELGAAEEKKLATLVRRAVR